jgi:spore maturation protein CgeB
MENRRRLNILLLKKKGCSLPWAIEACKDALTELGHNVEVWDVSLFEKSLSTKPDFILCNNHMGLSEEMTLKFRIPHACWLEDDPFYWIKKDSSSPYKLLFVYDKAYIPKLKKMGFERVYFLPLCTDSKRFEEIEASSGLICDVSFVGGSYYKSFEILEGFFKKWNDPKICEIAKKAITIQSENLSPHIYDILEILQEESQWFIPFEDSEGMVMFGRILAGAATSVYRKRIIENLDEFNLHIYGDEGWKKVIKGNNIKFMGSLPHKDLSKLFVHSKINLNLTTVPLKTTLTRRPFDVLACGGFVLSDYRQGIESLLEIDKEIVCFRDERELKEKLSYFLNHPEERRRIAKMGKKRVLREHTYRHRMEEMVNLVREFFGI